MIMVQLASQKKMSCSMHHQACHADRKVQCMSCSLRRKSRWQVLAISITTAEKMTCSWITTIGRTFPTVWTMWLSHMAIMKKKITWVSRHKKGRKSMKAINLFESIQGGIGDSCNSKSMYIRYGTERMFQLAEDNV